MARIRRIMCASDFSPASRPAFVKAVEMAKSMRAPLVITHVLAPFIPVVGEGYVTPETWERIETGARRLAQKHLGALLQAARRAGVRATALLVEGSAADRIVGAARRKRVDLLVVGTHGRTGLARAFLGSVAARVVATAPCPVLTVRGK
jgi:nucleotide-binding universal stress UspA family protein